MRKNNEFAISHVRKNWVVFENSVSSKCSIKKTAKLIQMGMINDIFVCQIDQETDSLEFVRMISGSEMLLTITKDGK